MSKVTFAILGMGNRGTKYAEKQLVFPDRMEVRAIADPRPVRIESANKFLNLPPERVFSSGEEMLAAPKLADIMIIATQDAQHRKHALAAMEKGYDLLLEKPIATSPEDCLAIAETAERLGRRVIVCHVLRYTVFYRAIRKLIADGVLGKVEAVNAEEQVGYYHYAHSYVRGNWHRREKSSPMILAKSCHDMDLFVWLTGRSCVSLNSYGSLDYFKAENCPEGAKERCTDGCTVDCPFNAPAFYYSRIPGWPSNILHPEPTRENILEALKTTDYGRCVYKMDNDVVDHETTNLLMDDGCTVTFSMHAFTNRQTRTIHVFGTKGDLVGDSRTMKISLRVFGKPEEEIDLLSQAAETGGHGGGDRGLVQDVLDLYQNVAFDSSSLTVIGRSVESHLMAFAAEASRLQGGAAIDMKQFTDQFRER